MSFSSAPMSTIALDPPASALTDQELPPDLLNSFGRFEQRVVPKHVDRTLQPYAETYRAAMGRPLAPTPTVARPRPSSAIDGAQGQ